MNTINIRGMLNSREPKKVKLSLILHRTGFGRTKKVLTLTGYIKDWDKEKQKFKANSTENQEKNRSLEDLKTKYLAVAEKWDKNIEFCKILKNTKS